MIKPIAAGTIAITLTISALAIGGSGLKDYFFSGENLPFGNDLDIFRYRAETDAAPLRREYEALGSLTEFTKLRKMNVRLLVPVKDAVSGSGESLDAVAQQTAVSNYVPKLAKKECNLILQTLAAKCELEKVLIRKAGAQEGLFEVSLHIFFTQKDDFGDFNREKPLTFELVGVPYFGGSRGSEKNVFSIRSLQRMRIGLYRKTAEKCRAIKMRYGNCAISYFTFSGYPSYKKGKSDVHSWATLSYIAER